LGLPAVGGSSFGVGFDPTKLVFGGATGAAGGAASAQPTFGVTSDPSQVAFQAAAASVAGLGSASKVAGGALAKELSGGIAESVAAVASEQATAHAAATGLGQVAASSFQAAAALQALAASGGGGFGISGAAQAASIGFAATGGRRMGLTVVGEEGPELLNFDRPGTIIPFRETTRILERAAEGGGGSVRQGDRIINLNSPLIVVEGGAGGADVGMSEQTIGQAEERLQEMLLRLRG
jgi:hypothetical protein